MAIVAVKPAFLGEPGQASPGGQPTTGRVPGSTGGAGGTNTSTQNTGTPTQLEPDAPASAPATTPAR